MVYFNTFLYFFSRIMYSTRTKPLPLSNSERQQRFRARKIAEMGGAFLKRESERVKAYQKVADMTDEEKARNRRLTNIRVRRHRKKKREEKLAAQADVVEDEDWSSDGSISDDDKTDDGGDSSDSGDRAQELRGMYFNIYSFIYSLTSNIKSIVFLK